MRSRSPLLVLVRAFVEYNPLFVLSAMALLCGVWLQNPPGGGGGRPAGLLLPLLLAERGYELALLAAMFSLTRLARTAPIAGAVRQVRELPGAGRLLSPFLVDISPWFGARAGEAWPTGRDRDVRGLGLVLAPFLVDVSRTHATAALLPETWPQTLLACAATLALTAAFAWTAARLIGRRYDPLGWVALLTPAALALGVPLLASYLSYRGAGPGEVTLGAGLGLALAIAASSLGWGRHRDGRVLGAISLGVLASHVLGTAWTHSGPLHLAIGPALIVLGPALPRLAWPGVPDRLTPLVLPIAGALAMGASSGEAPGAWPLALAGWTVLHALEAWRRRSLPFACSLLVALDLLSLAPASGFEFERTLDLVGRSPAELVALLGVFAWGLHRRAGPVALGLPLGLASLHAWQLGLLGPRLDPLLGLELLGAGLLAWSLRLRPGAPTGLRLVGLALLLLPGQLGLDGLAGPAALLLGKGPLVGLLLLALATRTRALAWPALLLPLEGAREVAPRGAGGWGALGIGLGFALVALGVALSVCRERLLAWLEPEPLSEDLPAPTPAGASARS